MVYTREDFFDLWDKLSSKTGNSYSKKKVISSLNKLEKYTFVSKFEMYHWIIKHTKTNDQFVVYKELKRDPNVSLNPSRKEILKNDSKTEGLNIKIE